MVTGAGSGLGRAFAERLARRGARLLLCDISLTAVQETLSMISGAREAHAVRCDVSKLAEVEALAQEADRLLGDVDLVINNAGVAVAGPVGEVPIADWEWVVGVNLWGVIYGCHVFVPRLLRRGRGHILNVASAAGLLAPPGMAPYNVTKAGVVALSEGLYAETQGRGVGVTVLCPTFFRTNIGKSARGNANLQHMVEKLMDRSSLSAEDVADLALAGVEAGELYVLPHTDGRWYWRLKRMLPGHFPRLAALAERELRRRASKG